MALKRDPWAQDPPETGHCAHGGGAGHGRAPIGRERLEMESVGSEGVEGGVNRGQGEGPPSQALLRAVSCHGRFGEGSDLSKGKTPWPAGLSPINQGQATGARWAQGPTRSLPRLSRREDGGRPRQPPGPGLPELVLLEVALRGREPPSRSLEMVGWPAGE